MRAFFGRLDLAGGDARALAGAQIAAVGPATADALREFGVRADFQPRTQTGTALAEELPGELETKNILIPRALEGDERMVEKLTAKGAVVDAAPAYQNVTDGAGADEVRARLAAGTVDVVTFTSSSTVKNFAAALAPAVLPVPVIVACIGPSTAQTATELLGRAPDIVAAEHTLPGLLAALEAHFAA